MPGYIVEIYVEDIDEKGIREFQEQLELANDDGVFDGYKIDVVNIEQIG